MLIKICYTSCMKLKTIYLCQNCQFENSKWAGKCPACGAWNSFIEDVISTETLKKERIQRSITTQAATPLSQTNQVFDRFITGLSELDRVLGGGIVPGSLILLGGEPGIGKSTLTLQLCANLTNQGKKILYISGEESIQQISLRAKRLKIRSENLLLLNETLLESILASFKSEKANVIIIDSIQVISSSEIPGLQGGVTQVRACTESLMEYAKSSNTPILIISHVTKSGNLAGPKTLEHLVDTVLYLEGDRYHDLRLVRGIKNRFGATSEVGIFEMTESGLKEISDPSKIFIENRSKNSIGSCLTVTIEGSRPFLVEVQALTNPTHFGYPKRTTSGFDLNRLQLLIATLQKHANLDLSNQDVYVNVVGGMKIKDPAADLAICLALISSFRNKPIALDLVAFGEVGLSGEVRKTAQEGRRLKEGQKWVNQVISPEKIKHLSEINRFLLS
ncbi:MAG: hypothetical protein UT36_C0008G0034 [Candidatus Peregrinibacteria bacterium GW2011_GWF2_39_17]|nr:MAG: hypothetical protein UT36_C0008G0034 [Candidatus Peregrinibacteria bacterium GW2011_GWF2_39_17]HCW32073.1 DNA repair protein RadA [Candidatus Peregrinibacteria bacterium]